MLRSAFLKLLALAPLSTRVLRQGWAHEPVYFGFGQASSLEPWGWKSGGLIYDHPVIGAVGGKWHRGIDLPLRTGTVITVALTGRVVYAGFSNLGYGQLVTIEGSRYKCRYAHLSLVWAVLGEWLRAGADVGLSGATGNTTGPHLHFEVYDKELDAYVNPLSGPVPVGPVVKVSDTAEIPHRTLFTRTLDSEYVG